jgi:ABC-2 type transport system ATP-binding protein
MGLLTVEHLHKQYATVHAVNDLSFTLNQGQIFALLGPNGAGKTSTVSMLIGLTRPDRGTVRYHAVNGEHACIVAHEMGYLPEERGLYQDQKIIDVLRYLGQLRGLSGRAARSAAEHWLQRFELSERAKEKVSALSKGNQQKVQLIAALLHQPRLLVLDEPFSGLDPINQELVLNLLRELREQGITILLSAHQMALIERLADHILLMNKGRQVLAGSMEQLRRDAGISVSLTLAYADGKPDQQTLHGHGVIDVQHDGDDCYKLGSSHISVTATVTFPAHRSKTECCF